jgi:hypothetical protein
VANTHQVIPGVGRLVGAPSAFIIHLLEACRFVNLTGLPNQDGEPVTAAAHHLGRWMIDRSMFIIVVLECGMVWVASRSDDAERRSQQLDCAKKAAPLGTCADFPKWQVPAEYLLARVADSEHDPNPSTSTAHH